MKLYTKIDLKICIIQNYCIRKILTYWYDHPQNDTKN
jgi:hypothetical protein